MSLRTPALCSRATAESGAAADLQQALRKASEARRRRLANTRGALVLDRVEAAIPEQSGGYHPMRVVTHVFKAMQHVRGAYLGKQLDRLERLGSLQALLDVVDAVSPPPKAASLPKAKKKRRRS